MKLGQVGHVLAFFPVLCPWQNVLDVEQTVGKMKEQPILFAKTIEVKIIENNINN